MIFRVRNEDPRPIYVQIMDEVKRARVLGLIGADEALPSVRQLAGDLRVNPNTVQQAYRELEREGVVHVRRGQGTYLNASSVNGRERQSLAQGVAERALQEGHRSGITAAELIAAIQSITDRAEGERR